MASLMTYHSNPNSVFVPREGMRCAVALDTSGGISYSFIEAQLSYIKEKFSSLENFEILVYTFDTRVYGPAKYNATNLEYITNIEFQGGGGTFFFPAYNAMKDSGADTFVMFSDGYFADDVRDVEDPRLFFFLCITGVDSTFFLPKLNVAHYTIQNN